MRVDQPLIHREFEIIVLPKEVPLVLYSNPAQNKKVIYADDYERAVIYLWENLKSGQIYVASSQDHSKRVLDYVDNS